MKLQGFFLCFLLLMATNLSLAAVEETLEAENKVLSLNAVEADWTFSGAVTNENGERYNYYFQMRRQGLQFTALATLIDGQTKRVLLFEKSNATILHPKPSNWQVGSLFLQFNSINNSWVFGVKNSEKKGFNFKADMLKKAEQSPATPDLRLGVELLVTQTGRLDGHIQIGSPAQEQFVSAPKAWFRQVWMNKPQRMPHLLTGILCQFNDGSAFYSVNLQETAALHSAIAGWRNPEGLPLNMSQFVQVKETKTGTWRIHIPSPNVNLLLQDALLREEKTPQLIAGLTEDLWPGFCTISKDEIGSELKA